MKTSTLIRKATVALRAIEKLDPVTADSEVFKREIEKARAIAYLVKTVSEIIEKHELEKRIEALEAILKEESGISLAV